MRFPEFLRTTVILSAASATVLAVITLVGAGFGGDDLLAAIAVCWWLIASLIGIGIGHHNRTTPPIARLLASARTQMSLPEMNPGRTVLNRLWPLLAFTLIAGGAVFVAAQVPAVATGFALIWALAWRHQALAVSAIEHRDGARFYVDHSSPIEAIKLVRTPGFRGATGSLDEPSAPHRIAGGSA